MGSTSEGITAVWWEFIPLTYSIDAARALLGNILSEDELSHLSHPDGPMSMMVRDLSGQCLHNTNISFDEVASEDVALRVYNKAHTFVYPVTLPQYGSVLYRIPNVTFLPFIESPGLFVSTHVI